MKPDPESIIRQCMANTPGDHPDKAQIDARLADPKPILPVRDPEQPPTPRTVDRYEPYEDKNAVMIAYPLGDYVLFEDYARLASETAALRTALEGIGRECPWPEECWPMTDAEYVKAVPDDALRTSISGFLMRKGWELAFRAALGVKGEA